MKMVWRCTASRPGLVICARLDGLTAAGPLVIECEQPSRRQRRGKGKSDPADAYLAVLAPLCLDTGRHRRCAPMATREALRILLVASQEITVTRTASANRLRALLARVFVDTAPHLPTTAFALASLHNWVRYFTSVLYWSLSFWHPHLHSGSMVTLIISRRPGGWKRQTIAAGLSRQAALVAAGHQE
jgi:hypothetical protein